MKNTFVAHSGKRRLVQKPSAVKGYWRERFVMHKSVVVGCLLKSQVEVDMNKERIQKETPRERARKKCRVLSVYTSITHILLGLSRLFFPLAP